MSAPSKKTDSSKMTERQIAEQKEAQKLKMYTCAFVAALVIIVLVAVYAATTSAISASGIHEKNTIAAKFNDYEISDADLSYYYVDAVNNYANTYGSYLSMFGLDTSKPLNEQEYDPTTGETWADYFIETAISNAKSVYAVSEKAKADGYVLNDEQKAEIENRSQTLDAYAVMSNVGDADAYVKAVYGKGTSKAGYLAYFERNMLASEYQSAHEASLTYTDDQIKAKDSEDPHAYTSYSYNSYYLSTSKFDDAAAAEAAANSLVEAAPATVADLDAAIAALEVNAETSAASTAYNNTSYSNINSNLTEWVTDSARAEGDLTVIPTKTTTTDESGNETESVSGYYVVFFRGSNDNENAMVNVRHILVSFSGDTNEDGTYTDEAKAASKTTAEEILNEWKAGDANEDSFAALANAKSTDSGSNTNGGLYENVYPGQMVEAFNDWCFDASRKAGDTDIVETNYGYHIMYFVGNTADTYRTYMIKNDLRTADMQEWYSSIVDAVTLVEGDTSYMRKDITLR